MRSEVVEKNCVFPRARRVRAVLVTTNNKCVLHSLRYTCVSPSLWHFILFRLALHAIKCVDYKVVAIDLILMLVCSLFRSLIHMLMVSMLECSALMSITLQTGHFTNCLFQTKNVEISHGSTAQLSTLPSFRVQFVCFFLFYVL